MPIFPSRSSMARPASRPRCCLRAQPRLPLPPTSPRLFRRAVRSPHHSKGLRRSSQPRHLACHPHRHSGRFKKPPVLRPPAKLGPQPPVLVGRHHLPSSPRRPLGPRSPSHLLLLPLLRRRPHRHRRSSHGWCRFRWHRQSVRVRVFLRFLAPARGPRRGRFRVLLSPPSTRLPGSRRYNQGGRIRRPPCLPGRGAAEKRPGGRARRRTARRRLAPTVTAGRMRRRAPRGPRS